MHNDESLHTLYLLEVLQLNAPKGRLALLGSDQRFVYQTTYIRAMFQGAIRRTELQFRVTLFCVIEHTRKPPRAPRVKDPRLTPGRRVNASMS